MPLGERCKLRNGDKNLHDNCLFFFPQEIWCYQIYLEVTNKGERTWKKRTAGLYYRPCHSFAQQVRRQLQHSFEWKSRFHPDSLSQSMGIPVSITISHRCCRSWTTIRVVVRSVELRLRTRGIVRCIWTVFTRRLMILGSKHSWPRHRK